MSVMHWLDILVRNTSPDIHYEGEWVSALPLSFVSPLSDKLYTLPEGKNGSFSYDFTGVPQLIVQGFRQSFWSKVGEDYNVECDIDPRDADATITLLPGPSDWALDLFTLCDYRNLSPEKNYTLKVTVESIRNSIIWFDALLLTPAPTANVDNALVIMDHHHPSLQFDSDWDTQSYSHVAHATNTSGSSMKLDFNGTSLKWYTAWIYLADPSPTNTVSTSTWTVDDGRPQTFINPSPEPLDRLGRYRHRLLFEISGLDPGLHHLEVTHHGDKASRPLSLSSLVIQNTHDDYTDLAYVPPPIYIPSPDEIRGPLERTKIGIAFIASAAAFVFCALLLFDFYRHRRREQQLKETSKDSGESGELSVFHDPGPSTSHSAPSTSPELSVRQESEHSKGTPVMPFGMASYPHEPISSRPTSKDIPTLTSTWRTEEPLPPPYQAALVPQHSTRADTHSPH
ncbi:hypothetical protein BJ165DRAFT_1573920 [Panaeolus papilionaceus]|nr:hypothetical protein BJ165DRAFT_1573920 [Panaeolus papilionaceus]